MSDTLLQPSLESQRATSIYSFGALVAAGFFGGAIAVTIVATLNSYLLKRLSRDALWLALGIVAGVATLFIMDAVYEARTTRELRYALRGVGLLLAGGYYLLHRSELRAMATVGIKARSPWLPVVGAIVAAAAWNVLLMILVIGHRP